MYVKKADMDEHQLALYEERQKRKYAKRREQGVKERPKGRQAPRKKVKRFSPKLKVYVADFETATQKWFDINGETSVWAWAITNVHPDRRTPLEMGDNAEVVINRVKEDSCLADRRYYTEFSPIESFFIELMKADYDGSIIYFHNLKFDGQFMLCHLLNRGIKDSSHFVYGYENGGEKVEVPENTYALLGDSSAWYSITLNLEGHKIEFRDSLKRIPMSVRQMAKEYNLPILKGEIDYDRNPDLPVSEEEEKYIRNDVLIVAEVLRQQYQEGFTEMTTASYSYNQYRAFLKARGEDINEIFGGLTEDQSRFARKSYEGGEVFCNPDYQDRFLGDPFSDELLGYTWDINSMYPAVYSCFPMPYGLPTTYEYPEQIYGADFYDYLQLFRWRGVKQRYFIEVLHIKARLKENRVPSVSIITGFNKRVFPKEIDLMGRVFADIRYEMILRDYDIEDLVLGRVDVYYARQDLFFDYVQAIVKEKNTASIEGNTMRKALAKVKMNSLYGKFAQRESVVSASYILNEYGELENVPYVSVVASKYVPLASIITAEARSLLISQANKFGYKNVIYMDTDSIHTLKGHNCQQYRRRPLPESKEIKTEQMNNSLSCEELYDKLLEFEFGRPNEIWCDEFDLGAFKIENYYSCGKWLRAKTYFEGNPVDEETVKDFFYCKENGIEKKEYRELYIIKGQGFYLLGQIKGAGIPDESKNQITVDNFEFGLILYGKLLPCRVKGGVILKESMYEIKEECVLSTILDKKE